MEFKERKPIYRQIADYVVDKIFDGTWVEGERILSVRELAVALEVNPNTVVRAYQHLQEDRLIENRRGIGYFTASGARDRASDRERRGFIEDQVPEFFRTMDKLGVSIDEIQELYRDFRQMGS